MTRLIPFPVLWVLLLFMWLALNAPVSIAQVLLGAVVATAGGLALAMLEPGERGRRPRSYLVAELIVVVLADVIRSNLAVAVIVFSPRRGGRTAGFVRIPLQLRDRAGLAALACIITSTPGTAWAGYDSESGVLTLHIFDFLDEATWMRIVHDRYERRLMRIFE